MASGQWDQAADHFLDGMVDDERLGGSRAQRDLLHLALAACLTKAGKVGEARSLIRLSRPVLQGSAVTRAILGPA